tara:strand:- start:359 stop:826 length:468 start_codon:yes stop_codon:yes gene_type:complete
MTGVVEARLNKLGIELPSASTPVANYVMSSASGKIVQLSGHAPQLNNGSVVTGRLGDNMDVSAGADAARLVGLQLLASLQQACGGTLDQVKQCVRLYGLVLCTSQFTAHASVMNGASDLMVEVFGDAGRHARTTIGARALPFGIAVEIEGTFELH